LETKPIDTLSLLSSWMSESTPVEVFAEVDGMMFRGWVRISSIDLLSGIEFVNDDRYLILRLNHQSVMLVETSGDLMQVKISSRWGECLVQGQPPLKAKSVIQ
jgi:hypothetical protein